MTLSVACRNNSSPASNSTPTNNTTLTNNTTPPNNPTPTNGTLATGIPDAASIIALALELEFKSGINPTGAGDWDGAINGVDGKPIKAHLLRMYTFLCVPYRMLQAWVNKLSR